MMNIKKEQFSKYTQNMNDFFFNQEDNSMQQLTSVKQFLNIISLITIVNGTKLPAIISISINEEDSE